MQKNNSKRIKISILLIFLSLIQVVFCQEKIDNSSDKNNNKWALQFQIGNNFTLSSFEGSTISLVRNLSQNSKLRFGISVDGEIKNVEKNIIQGANCELGNNEMYFSSTLHYIKDLKKNSKIFPYAGIGPIFSFYNQNKNKKTKVECGTTKTSYDLKEYGLGISAVFGTEWFLTSNISLLAEYNSSILYNKTKTTSITKRKTISAKNYTQTDKNIIKTNSFSIDPASVKFGLSVYF